MLQKLREAHLTGGIFRQVPQIGSLEEQVYALYRQRAQKMVQRRRQDVRDQNDEFSPFAGMDFLPTSFVAQQGR